MKIVELMLIRILSTRLSCDQNKTGPLSVENRPRLFKTLGLLQTALLQQLQERLRRRVGLRQGSDRGLLQDLRLGQVGRFRSDVRVANRRLRSREAGDLRLRQLDGVVQLVFAGSDGSLDQAEIGDGRGDVGQRSERIGFGVDQARR